MPKKPKPPLTFPQYERIFRIIHGVLLNEDCDPSKSCMYFSIIGAFILQQHHQLSPSLRAGAAAYNFGLSQNQVIAFGRVENGHLVSDDNAFHFWIEIGDWIVDLSAPLFQANGIQPKMFQKPKNTDAPDQANLDIPGTFTHSTNGKLTSDLFRHFQSYPMNVDLTNICTQWYKPPPKPMIPIVPIADSKGNMSEVRQSPIVLVGAW